MDTIGETLLLALEQLGKEWEETKLPQEILLNDDNVTLILNIRQLVADPKGLSADTIRSRAPTFVEQLQLATMKEL